MHTKHNPTMASAASPSATDPKMADLCNHTAHASSSDGFAEDGYSTRPIQPNIDWDIWSVCQKPFNLEGVDFNVDSRCKVILDLLKSEFLLENIK